MEKPKFTVGEAQIRAFAEMQDLFLTEAEIPVYAAAVAGGMASLAALRDIPTEGLEPFITFPLDRDGRV